MERQARPSQSRQIPASATWYIIRCATTQALLDITIFWYLYHVRGRDLSQLNSTRQKNSTFASCTHTPQISMFDGARPYTTPTYPITTKENIINPKPNHDISHVQSTTFVDADSSSESVGMPFHAMPIVSHCIELNCYDDMSCMHHSPTDRAQHSTAQHIRLE